MSRPPAVDSLPMTMPDATALAALLNVRPAWDAMVKASAAVPFARRTLLHCGPPASPAHALVQPTRNSAAVACVFEGWASSLSQAHRLVDGGDIDFLPAQDFNVATPMAAVVSPSMQLIRMIDLNGSARPAFAPINGGGTGGDPAPRYGRSAPECVDFLRFLNHELAPMLARSVASPMPWLPIIDHALQCGDDTHLRHDAAHALLVHLIRQRVGSELENSPCDAFMVRWPFFHLNFWMAAIRLALGAAQGVAGSSLITAFGGNGEHFGLKVSGLPKRWWTCRATPPLGRLRAPHTVESTVAAYGDSAIVEAFGLGAMAHAYAPQMQAFHAEFYHDDLLSLPRQLLARTHPALVGSRARVGLCARRVVSLGITPVVELGIVEASGRDGGLGAGLYRPPLDPFVQAVGALDQDH